MKLYTQPGACSLSCHIALQEAKIPHDIVLAAREGADTVWSEIEKLNPQGLVPVLVLDNGKPLTQNVGILTYVAERAPQSNLLPASGTVERAQTYQWAAWVASDLHPSFHPLFGESSPEVRQKAVDKVTKLLEQAEKHLEGKTYLMGNQFTIADCYFFVVYNWTRHVKVPTDQFRNINSYCARITERPSTQAAMKREGLLK